MSDAGLAKADTKQAKVGRPAGAILFPRSTLKDCLRVPKTIWEENSGKPMTLQDLANHLMSEIGKPYSPTSSTFRDLIRSTQRYGLIEGSWSPEVTATVSLSPLGTKLAAPTPADDTNGLMKEALLFSKLFAGFLTSIQGRVIPPEDQGVNSLMRDFHMTGKDEARLAFKVIMKNIDELGIFAISGAKKYLRLDKLGAAQIASEDVNQLVKLPAEGEGEEAGTGLEGGEGELTPPPPPPERPKQIFVAHGKNKKPLEQLKAILTQFHVPFQVAVDEPHKGRAITEKVAEIMKNCTSGIFIFTADEETTDVEGKKVLRPSDNVVFELGAGTVLYGKNILIFREEGVEFGSDFTDYGRYSFEKDKLDAKAFELMKELIDQGFLKVTPR